MSEILKGAPVAAEIIKKAKADSLLLKEKGISPTLAIVRVGERPDDLSYENGLKKRCDEVGVTVKNVVLPSDIENESFLCVLKDLAVDNGVHGILMFRPLPSHLDEQRAVNLIPSGKDVDGCTASSLASVFMGLKTGFAPCTAQAAMEILKYYGTDLSGKRAVIIGRSLVVGKPLAMLLLQENATITVCHSKTKNLANVAREADIVIACMGKTRFINASYLRDGQTVIDVGINLDEEANKLCGDVDFQSAFETVSAITPVPGGVGSVTTCVTAMHVVEAAKKSAEEII